MARNYVKVRSRNMSDKSSAYAELIGNNSEKDITKDVAQFDDIFRTFHK